MKKFDLTTEYATYKDCYFIINKYQKSDSVALEIWNDEDGPIARITTYITQVFKANEAYLDTNNCPWAEELVKKLGIAEYANGVASSGFCIYRLYEFDMDKVKEYAEGGE